MLTPERRAELRGLAESAQPFIRHGGTDPAAVYVPATELTALLDAADERDRLAAQVEAVRALHVPFRIYDECECEDTTTPGHVDVEEVGITCNLLHIACRECCTSGVDIRYQTEDCANGHDHRDTQCPTIAALDGPGESA